MEHTDRLAACGVLSNCDRGWLHDDARKSDSPRYPMRLEKAGIELVPGMKIETIQPHVEELYGFMKKSNETYKGTFVQQPWVAAYATMFARCAIDEVGLFDPLYKNGCEDWDLCHRISKYGYVIGQAIDSFVFHYGGVSRGAYQNENRDSYDKEDHENHFKMQCKWGQERVVIWTGPAVEPWSAREVEEGMAGSESWATYLAREFVKKGYKTYIYNDLFVEDKQMSIIDSVKSGDGVRVGDVIYRHFTNIQDDFKYDVIDYFISSRSVEPLKSNIHSLRNYVMIHDVFIHPNPEMDVMPWRVDKYAYLSEWHKEFIKQHHKSIPDNKLFLTANGVDTDLYSDVDKIFKKNKSVYSSSPDRGLYQLLLMVPEIRKRVPDFELYVAYGFKNWEVSAKARNDTDSLKFMKKIKELMDKPGVVYLGRINKKELARHQKESKVWLYPVWFFETFCITSVECGLSKCALLTSDLGGLKTTVKESAVMLPAEGLSRDAFYPDRYTANFIEEAVKLLQDDSYREAWAEKAYAKAIKYRWDIVADGWVSAFKG
jgi:hypothetical protein